MVYNRPDSVECCATDYAHRFGSEAQARRRLFNVGAGAWSHPCWTNIDLPAQTPAFAAIQAPCIHHDLVGESELPIEAGEVEAFYSCHVVEHLPEDRVRILMREAFRCLKPGGCFRIVTGPCADLDWQALLRGDRDWWFWMNEPDFAATVEKSRSPMTIHDRWLYHLATPRSAYSDTPCEEKFDASRLTALVAEHANDPRPLLDMLTRPLPFSYRSPGDHISWWNSAKLESFMHDAGFPVVFRSAYGQSTSIFMRDLRYFDQTYPQISVYVEAVK